MGLFYLHTFLELQTDQSKETKEQFLYWSTMRNETVSSTRICLGFRLLGHEFKMYHTKIEANGALFCNNNL